MPRDNEPTPARTQLESEAIRLLDDAIVRMGSDPCIYSIDLAIDHITSELATTPNDYAAVRSLLRGRVGLDLSTPSVHIPEKHTEPRTSEAQPRGAALGKADR